MSTFIGRLVLAVLGENGQPHGGDQLPREEPLPGWDWLPMEKPLPKGPKGDWPL